MENCLWRLPHYDNHTDPHADQHHPHLDPARCETMEERRHVEDHPNQRGELGAAGTTGGPGGNSRRQSRADPGAGGDDSESPHPGKPTPAHHFSETDAIPPEPSPPGGRRGAAALGFHSRAAPEGAFFSPPRASTAAGLAPEGAFFSPPEESFHSRRPAPEGAFFSPPRASTAAGLAPEGAFFSPPEESFHSRRPAPEGAFFSPPRASTAFLLPLRGRFFHSRELPQAPFLWKFLRPICI